MFENMTQLEKTQILFCKASIYSVVEERWCEKRVDGSFLLYRYNHKPDDMHIFWTKHDKSLSYQLISGIIKPKEESEWIVQAIVSS